MADNLGIVSCENILPEVNLGLLCRVGVVAILVHHVVILTCHGIVRGLKSSKPVGKNSVSELKVTILLHHLCCEGSGSVITIVYNECDGTRRAILAYDVSRGIKGAYNAKLNLINLSRRAVCADNGYGSNAAVSRARLLHGKGGCRRCERNSYFRITNVNICLSTIFKYVGRKSFNNGISDGDTRKSSVRHIRLLDGILVFKIVLVALQVNGNCYLPFGNCVPILAVACIRSALEHNNGILGKTEEWRVGRVCISRYLDYCLGNIDRFKRRADKCTITDKGNASADNNLLKRCHSEESECRNLLCRIAENYSLERSRNGSGVAGIRGRAEEISEVIVRAVLASADEGEC